MRYALVIALAGILSLTLFTGAAPTTKPAEDVHAITLPQFDADLPPGPNRNVVMIRCAVCHTTHYILNQPAFSQKVWTAEVAKMRTSYGAPMSDDEAAKIVDYLVAAHGAANQ
jgi:LSD1 subclass zinc finger protein